MSADINAMPCLAKRRTANHPCPVCGKHYVNEGSLRKHLACHPETAQFATSLRMWPCSVCQAVFTYESGLLSHMEHMRMDPKHQFAAQYVLSRAAAERRERGLMAAAVAASGGLPLSLSLGQCASPSAHSDSSSNAGERLSSAGSEPGINTTSLMLNNNNNNNNNNNTASAKLAELMTGRSGASNGHHFLSPQTQHYNADELQRAAALLVGQQQAAAAVQTSSPPTADSPRAAAVVQAAAANLAAAMRMSQTNAMQHNSQTPNQSNNGSVPTGSPDSMSSAVQMAMNAAVRASMSSMVVDVSMNHHQGNHHQSVLHQQNQSTNPLRVQEAFLRSQAEAALRLAVTQAVVASTSTASGDNGNNHISGHNSITQSNALMNGQHPYHQNRVSPDLTEALRLQEQRLEQALRLHGDPRALGFTLPNNS